MAEDNNRHLTKDKIPVYAAETTAVAIKLGQKTDQDYNYAKSSTRLNAIVNSTGFNSLTGNSQQDNDQGGRSAALVGKKPTNHGEALQKEDRGSTELGINLVASNQTSQKISTNNVPPLKSNGDITFQSKESRIKNQQCAFHNFQAIDLGIISDKPASSDSQQQNFFVSKNQDLSEIAGQNRRYRGNHIVKIDTINKRITNPKERNHTLAQSQAPTTVLSPRSYNLHQLARLRLSKENLANKINNFPRRKVKRNMKQGIKRERYHDQLCEVISLGRGSENGYDTGSHGSPLPQQPEWITSGLNSQSYYGEGCGPEAILKEVQQPSEQVISLTLASGPKPQFTALKQTFLGFKKRIRQHESPVRQLQVRQAPFHSKIRRSKEDGLLGGQTPNKNNSKNRPNLQHVMPSVDKAAKQVDKTSQKSQEACNIGQFELPDEEIVRS